MPTGLQGASLDKRRHAYRRDLADARLRGRVSAERFVDGRLSLVASPSAPLRSRPDADAAATATLLLGETVRVFEDREDGWSWVQMEWDGYVGYAPSASLRPFDMTPDFAVSALFAHFYAEPDMKTPPIGAAPLCARLSLDPQVRPEGRFLPLRRDCWIHENHVRPIGAPAGDWVAIAELFLGVPYLWGGETLEGVDCSGLIKTALRATERRAPRDSDMQAEELGAPLPAQTPFARGDLVFWRGHVGVMQNAEELLHANAWHMSCVSEPLAEAIGRIDESGGGGVLARRRLS